MDLAYLKAHPRQLSMFLLHQRIRETPVPGGSICAASRLTLDDGSSIFAKSWPSGKPPEGFFAAEAAGLRSLSSAGAPVPELIAELPTMLGLEWIEPGRPDPAAAERLGRDLAALHQHRAPHFGADWPGYIGALPLDNEPAEDGWPEWFAAKRLLPYLRTSVDTGALSGGDAAAVTKIIENVRDHAGPAADEPPVWIHGDLWPGNVLWSASGRAYLVDPATHGGHRETDLANLALFGGLPHLDRVLHAYEEVHPLSDGWRERVALHQLHLLLVHTAMFGSAYGPAVMSAVRATVER